ncbi:hypothetical protein [uncultured Alistipes sp.]|nr:hypothetical protein [uncultured Alistipes sp.]
MMIGIIPRTLSDKHTSHRRCADPPQQMHTSAAKKERPEGLS